jgi:mRNA interferase MazF
VGAFVKGDVVVVPFPFSNLKAVKRRPALVLVDLPGDDLILCQITSQTVNDDLAVTIDIQDILGGSLTKISSARTNKLFTIEASLVAYKVGSLKDDILNEIIDKLVSLLK